MKRLFLCHIFSQLYVEVTDSQWTFYTFIHIQFNIMGYIVNNKAAVCPTHMGERQGTPRMGWRCITVLYSNLLSDYPNLHGQLHRQG